MAEMACSVEGYSRGGSPVELFTSGVDGPSSSLDTLFIGVFHGDEPYSGQLLHEFLKYLKASPQTIQQKSVGIIPVLNPDGLKNNTRFNGGGVDLNRNYPTRDWLEDNLDTPYYSGPRSASEPETLLLLRLLQKYTPKKIVTVHTPYRVVNYDGPARGLAEAMSACNTYPVMESIGYPTPGSFGTYCGVERNIPVVTLELPEDIPFDQVCRENLEALVAAVRY